MRSRSMEQMNTLEKVFDKVVERTGYPAADVILTMNGKRLYKWTVIDTLTIWRDADIGQSKIL